MRKLFMISAFALTLATSCQNETTGRSNDLISTSTKDVSKLERQALNLVKGSLKKAINKSDIETEPTPITDAVILCHTDWLAESGVSCVSNGGYLFKVMWDLEDPWDSNNTNKVWFTVRVSSCNCN